MKLGCSSASIRHRCTSRPPCRHRWSRCLVRAESSSGVPGRAASHHRLDGSPLPAVRHRRLRRRQDFRVPHHPPRRARLRRAGGVIGATGRSGNAELTLAPRHHPPALYAVMAAPSVLSRRAGSAARARRRDFALHAAVAADRGSSLSSRCCATRSTSAVCGATGASLARFAAPLQAKAPELVQSHERLLCCDVYRAGDGVHRVWLDERLRDASAFDRWRVEIEFLPSIPARHRTPSVRESLAARCYLQFKNGSRRDSRALRLEPRETAGDL